MMLLNRNKTFIKIEIIDNISGKLSPENHNKKVLKKSFDIPEGLKERVDDLLDDDSMMTFSEYVRSLIREDLKEKGY